jgi:hypothetical protein
MVFNIAGQEVEKIWDQTLNMGNYWASLDGHNTNGDIVGNAVNLIVI